jgi:hypothetical protein
MTDSFTIEQTLKNEWSYKCLSNDMMDWLLQYKQLFFDAIDTSSTSSMSKHSIQIVYLLYLQNKFPENICVREKKTFIYYGIINKNKYWIDQRLLESDWIKLFSHVYQIVLEDKIDKYRDAGILQAHIHNTTSIINKPIRKSYSIFKLCKRRKTKSLNYLNID